MRKLLVIALGLLLTGCGYNEMQRLDEAANAGWSEVLNQYKRRADLVPNLVAVVQGYAAHEKDVLVKVTEARSKVGSLQITDEMMKDPQALANFQAAQASMTSALSRLLLVAENYPQLKADANFRDLQAQLEGTENRIAVARGRFIKAVQDYNTAVRVFPNNLTAMIFGLERRPTFAVEDEKAISAPPTVNFGTPAPAPAK